MSSIASLFNSQSASVEQILNEIESQRKASILPCFAWALGISAVVILISWTFCGFDWVSFLICVFIVIPGAIYGSYCYFRSQLSAIYKNEVLPKLVKALETDMKSAEGADFQYNHLCEVSPTLFRNSRIFASNDNDYTVAEDQIIGKVGKTDFNFCEAYYSFQDTDSDGDTIDKTLFRGMIFDADFNKKFNGITVLAPNRTEGTNNSFFSEVKLEDADFGRLFKVYSTDQVEARYILTPALQEKLVNLVQSLKNTTGEKKVMLSFFNSRLLLLIPSSVDHFEAKLFSPLKLDRVKHDFQLIYDMVAIVGELNLNTRIWTKQ